MLGAVISTYHLAIKFLSTLGDIVTVHVDQPTVRRCYADSLRERPIHQVESPTPPQYQNQTQVFSPGKSSVANGKCCPKTRGEVLTQLGKGHSVSRKLWVNAHTDRNTYQVSLFQQLGTPHI